MYPNSIPSAPITTRCPALLCPVSSLPMLPKYQRTRAAPTIDDNGDPRSCLAVYVLTDLHPSGDTEYPSTP